MQGSDSIDEYVMIPQGKWEIDIYIKKIESNIPKGNLRQESLLLQTTPHFNDMEDATSCFLTSSYFAFSYSVPHSR